MTPEDLSILVERLLDDDLTPGQRATLAAQLVDDDALQQRLAGELGLALQIRAVLAEDAEIRADLLLATVSGSRRLALAQRIDHAIDLAAAPPARARWLPWSGLAAAAAVLLIVIAGWSLPRAPSPAPPRPLEVAAPTSPAPAPAPPVLPPSPATVTVTVPQALDGPVAAIASPVAVVVVVPDIVAPTAPESPAPAPAIAANALVPVPRDDADVTSLLKASQANPMLAKADPKALRLVPPLMINGAAQVRRQGRVADSAENLRLIPGDELRVGADGAELRDERGLTWWCGPDTRLALAIPRVVEAARQPLHVTLGTLHVTAAMGLRPLITTPHLRIDAEEAELWLTVTTLGTRVETVSGSVRIEITSVTRPGATAVRPGAKAVRPLAPGFYALCHPGQAPEIHQAGAGRLSVLSGRFTRDGVLLIPRILRGVSATIAADLGGTAVQAPLGDGAWLDQAAYRHLHALVELPASTPAMRVLRHPALGAWIATSDARAALAMRRADPLRPIHLAGPAPTKLPAWATSSELATSDEAPVGRATLAVIAVDARVEEHSWDALIRGAQGLIWTIDEQTPAEALRPLIAALEVGQGLLIDGARVRLDLGSGFSAARWDRPGRRLVVVINHADEARAVAVPQTRGLAALAADDSWAVATSGELTTATLPPHGVLILSGARP